MRLFVICALIGAASVASAEVVDRHVTVYYEDGRFGGWPANHGMWNWDNEILVGFSRGYYKDLGDRHHFDRDKPEEHCLARSLDGGETWTVEHPNEEGYLLPRGASLHGVELPGVELPPLMKPAGGIDFAHPDFALTIRMSSVHAAPARFEYSYDRGRTWEGPFRFPDLGTPGIAARTDYLVDGTHAVTAFLTGAKSNEREGRPLAARTTDGGATWEFLGWMGPEPEGFAIMPSGVRLSENELFAVVRQREGDHRHLVAYRSEDNGVTWTRAGVPDDDLGIGNPPSLIRLYDGRLCLTFGDRKPPYGIAARLSDDGGRTWSDRVVLRDDGTSRDIGYPRSVQRPDGKVVTTYYFTDAAHDPERYIAATIWDPAKVR